jgi:alkanesulfonate monooxygenase SsuD/methylene tetrahydromethanopterin reductase-like flavin-dependent oxidoreductase (luciferase family)
VDLRIFTEPQQGASYDDLLRVAKATEDAGYDAFFRSDHYLKMGEVSGEPGPTDAWITLAGLARETSRIRLGTLVNSATFRLPGPLAIAVAQVDASSWGWAQGGSSRNMPRTASRSPASENASTASRSSWR